MKNYTDGKERIFQPYKGWMIIDENGKMFPDPITQTNEGPLKLVMNYHSGCDRHITYNILNENGENILPNSVRSIKYNKQGYYIVEDNNEDDLVVKYRCIPVEKYWSKYNIVTNDGVLLSEEWFDDITPSLNGYVSVKRNGKRNLMDLLGRLYFNTDAECISFFNGDYAYCYRDGIIYKAYPNGKEIECKKLAEINDEDYEQITKGNVVRCCTQDWSLMNIMLMSKYMLFEQWYDNIKFAGYGLFLCAKNGIVQLIDMASNILTNHKFNVNLLDGRFHDGQIIVEVNNEYGLMNTSGEMTFMGYSSVLWAERDMWLMHLCHNGKGKRYFHGQGDEVIQYAQQLLVSNDIICLFEKDNIWYYPDSENNMISVFEFDPKDV